MLGIGKERDARASREEKERKSSCFHVVFVIIFLLLFRIQVKKKKKEKKRGKKKGKKKKKRTLTFTGSNHFTICSGVLLPEHTSSAAEQSALCSPSFRRQGCQQFLNCNSMNKAFFFIFIFPPAFFFFFLPQSLEFLSKGRRVRPFHQIVSKTELFPLLPALHLSTCQWWKRGEDQCFNLLGCPKRFCCVVEPH